MGQAGGELEGARTELARVANEFADAAGPVIQRALSRSLNHFVEQQADRISGFDDETMAAFRRSIGQTIRSSAAAIASRIRERDLWTSPNVGRVFDEEWAEPSWKDLLLDLLPDVALRRRRKREPRPEQPLDHPNNRVWIALLNAADPLDPVLEEFGFHRDPDRPVDPGGAHFGLQPTTLLELDPQGTLAKIWARYLPAFDRYLAARGNVRRARRERAIKRWRDSR